MLYLPTCVGFGTDTTFDSLEAFLGSMASANPHHPKDPRPITFQGSAPVDLPAGTPYGLGPPLPIGG